METIKIVRELKKSWYETTDRIRTKTVDLQDYMEGLFPETVGTPIPATICSLTADLSQICKLDNGMLVRGSTVKRYLFGTPQAYWDVSRIFSASADLAGNEEEKKLVDHLAVGPRDLDIRYCLRDGISEGEVKTFVQKSLVRAGFLRDEKLGFVKGTCTADITEVKIGGVMAEPRTFLSVNFHTGPRLILRLDLGSVAESFEQDDEDFRRGLHMANCEIFSTADLFARHNQVLVKIPPYLKDTFYEPKGSWIAYKAYLDTYYFAYLKGLVGNRVFWPIKYPSDREAASRRNGAHLLAVLNPLVLLSDAYKRMTKTQSQPSFFDTVLLLCSSNWRSLWDLAITETGMAKLKQRQTDINNHMLLYLTYDPFAFLNLLFFTNMISLSPIGSLIKDIDELNQLCGEMAQELQGFDYKGPKYIPDGTDNVLKASSAYKTQKLVANPGDLTLTGPFMLLRALKRLGRLPPETPETISTAIILLNPLPGIEEKFKSESKRAEIK